MTTQPLGHPTTYEPQAWQALHPAGTRMIYVGLDRTGRTPVQVGKASRTGVRVKFPAAAGGWQRVYPGDLADPSAL